MHVKRKRSKGYLRRPPKLIVDRQPKGLSNISPVYEPGRPHQFRTLQRWGRLEFVIDDLGTQLTFHPHPLFEADLPVFSVHKKTEFRVLARAIRVLGELIEGRNPMDLEP
ncbi:hypothetical protein [Rubinisphaera brasiliensis]|uniref:Uncharacterized protein n=1 Tax=Rubinisphaera brasiliensis (strain ATCC 49424 / DSM 5305 / JCM 21570 / IAM 15109 / NBRC 103401 / IFAM 1448) TaxID=756272 RepID=F0SNJ1_RUBBR|nr:hypothetical protein [Rubinisphaera brasiliensis]ADY57825.1 hypothetical protein Plabr_0195 [Rubinisphaera brasiliensis DSM 5305]